MFKLTRHLSRFLSWMQERNHRRNLRELGINPNPLRFKTVVK